MAEYIGRKHRPDWRSGDPAEVAVADVLALYGTERRRSLRIPSWWVSTLGTCLLHFGDKYLRADRWSQRAAPTSKIAPPARSASDR